MEMYLNGRFVPYESAQVAIDNRGFQFSESVYEFIHCYNGRPFEMERHMRRFRNSAMALGMDMPEKIDELGQRGLELLDRNGVKDINFYMQVTSGTLFRSHLNPGGLEPTFLTFLIPSAPAKVLRDGDAGLKVITVPDERWARCYIKTTQLLPNTMAKRRAADVGCNDALFIRDGFLTEGTASNAFAVFGGVLCTPAKSNYILHGVAREVVLEIAKDLGIPASEGPIPAAQLLTADEIFITGTSFELSPVTQIDGRVVGAGKPGPIYQRLHEAYQRRTQM